MPRTIKRGDTFPPLTGRVEDATGGVALGSADEVKVICKCDAPAETLELVVTVTDAVTVDPNDPDCGAWTYTWTAADTDVVGVYSTETQVTWSAGVIQTFPEDPANNDTLTIAQDLGD